MQNIPHFPAEFPLITLIELLFGLGFNLIVDWSQRNNLWHVSVSVVMGVFGTILIPTLMVPNLSLFFWQTSVFYFACFSASGLPMVIGSTKRTVKENHRRRPLPNNAMRVRDEVVMDMNSHIEQIVAKEAEVAELVHVMHQWIGKLKSL
jgi:hypothetical protein